MADERRFERICRGVYATEDRRFMLEDRGSGSDKRWRLLEQGELSGFKPGKLPTATALSPIWFRSDSARAAIAWAMSWITAK